MFSSPFSGAFGSKNETEFVLLEGRQACPCHGYSRILQLRRRQLLRQSWEGDGLQAPGSMTPGLFTSTLGLTEFKTSALLLLCGAAGEAVALCPDLKVTATNQR